MPKVKKRPHELSSTSTETSVAVGLLSMSDLRLNRPMVSEPEGPEVVISTSGLQSGTLSRTASMASTRSLATSSHSRVSKRFVVFKILAFLCKTVVVSAPSWNR